MTHVRENFRIMEATNTPFVKKTKLSLSRNFAILLFLLFVICLVGTGLLVYHFSSCSHLSRNIITPTEVCNHTPHDDPPPTDLSESETSTSGLSSSTESALKPDKPVDVRLPRSVVPLSYEVKIVPFVFEGNFTFRGEVRILVRVNEDTANVTLHADELDIDGDSVQVYETFGDPAKNDLVHLAVTSLTNDTERQFFVVNLQNSLQAGHEYYVQIKYVGILNDVLQGFYRSFYKVNNEIRWIAATQFQPTDARKAFPCFDEPALKAKFHISLGRLKNMTSLSNMPRLGYPQPMIGYDEYVWDVYQESVPMSTYLVAFVVSDFDYIRNGSFSVWAHKEVINQTRFSLEIGPKILQFYEEYFDIKFPLPKIDMIAIPDFSAGAMENWGLIMYRESTMLYEEGISTRLNLQRIATIISHELAHQWFGNLVTPKWWTDLWLNEGFASYMEYIGTNAVSPEWKILDQFVINEVQNVFALDALKTSHKISVKVNNPVEINDIFDRISYAKGATIIRMMEHFLTPNVFKTALSKYLKKWQYSNADQDDLWASLTEEAISSNIFDETMSVKEIMDTWTLQTGFPVVTVLRNYEDGSVLLEQERYFLDKPDSNLTSSLWWIPITYTYKNGSDKLVWMRQEAEVTLPNPLPKGHEWILLNLDQMGYYRVNYDLKNWNLLIEQLLDKKGFQEISAANRAQILDDALNLALAGYLNYEAALNVTKYLVHEKDYVPWKAAFNGLDYLLDMFVHSEHFDKYKDYMLYLLEDIYREIGFSSKNYDQLTIYNRVEVIWRSCILGNIDCVANAITQFQNWRSSPDPDNSNPISPDLKAVVYCIAIRAGSHEEWDFAWLRYLNTKVVSEKEILLSALGCTRETWLLSRYLHWSIRKDSGIRKQDSARVFSAVASNVIGQELTYKFLKTNWKRIKKYMGSSLILLNSIVKACTSNFNTVHDLFDLKNFAQTQKADLEEVTKTLQQSIEQTEGNVRWMENNFDTIVRWIISQKTVS